jgi:hypothetical protein
MIWRAEISNDGAATIRNMRARIAYRARFRNARSAVDAMRENWFHAPGTESEIYQIVLAMETGSWPGTGFNFPLLDSLTPEEIEAAGFAVDDVVHSRDSTATKGTADTLCEA